MTPRKKPKAAEPEAVKAAEPEEASISESLGIERIVAFLLGTQRYALPIDRVQEIQQIVAFADMPDKGGAVLGMVNLRGQVIPAVDARTLLGMSPQEYTLETPMVVCRIGDGLAALIVDDVDDVIELPEGYMQPVPKMHPLASRMMGVCQLEQGMVFVLDVERLMELVDLQHGEGGECG